MTNPANSSCRVCGEKGKTVKPVTIESLLTENAMGRVSNPDGFRFCLTPSCEVAYYRPGTEERFLRRDVRVRIGLKEVESPRTVCYCFEHTVEEIKTDVATTGTSSIPDEIVEKCRQGLDRCPTTNPHGSCCLGTVKGVLQAALASRSGDPCEVTGGSSCRDERGR